MNFPTRVHSNMLTSELNPGIFTAPTHMLYWDIMRACVLPITRHPPHGSCILIGQPPKKAPMYVFSGTNGFQWILFKSQID